MPRVDRLLPSRVREHLRTRCFGRRIYYYPETDSTNRVALSLARAGEGTGTVVVADYQSRGRGRGDHGWWSRAGEDLLFTVVLRPDPPPATMLPITLVFSAAVSTELSAALGVDVMVEWPNDMVTGGGKIGGILAEGASAGETPFAVVGTGLNVNSRRSGFPEELRPRVTTCRTVSGRACDRALLLARILEALENTYERFLALGFAGMRLEYEERLAYAGRSVTFVRRGRPLVATVEGVDDDGALRVLAGGGRETIKLYSEEVSRVR
jgi:BirA family biotin operon repressor/biotin-[acetyl-CoA-carboxylase] ligase